MSKQLPNLDSAQLARPKLEDYFIRTGFYDLLPIALKLAGNLGYEERDMIEAVCKVSDKFYQYPPTKNRTAWFKKVFEEKLLEARGDILYNEVSMKGWQNKCKLLVYHSLPAPNRWAARTD